MSEPGLIFDRDSAKRIGRTVRKVEGLSSALTPGDGKAGQQVPRTALVQPTSSTPVTDGTNYYLPGIVLSGLGDPTATSNTSAQPPGTVTPNMGQLSANSQDCWIACSNQKLLPKQATPAILNGQWRKTSIDPYLPVFTASVSPLDWITPNTWLPQTIITTRSLGALVLPATIGLYTGSGSGGIVNTGSSAWLLSPNTGYDSWHDYLYCQQVDSESGTGVPVYAAIADRSPVWLQCTSSTPQSVGLSGTTGGAFAATIFYPRLGQGQGGLNTTSQNAWIVPVSTQQVSGAFYSQVAPPVVGRFYQGYFCGLATGGLPGFVIDAPEVTPAPAIQFFAWSAQNLANNVAAVLATLTLPVVTPIYRTQTGSFTPTYEINGIVTANVSIPSSPAAETTAVSAWIAASSSPSFPLAGCLPTGRVSVPPIATPGFNYIISVPVKGVISAWNGGTVTLSLIAFFVGPTGATVQIAEGDASTSPPAVGGCVTVQAVNQWW